MGESSPYYPVINGAADPTGRDIEVRIRKEEKRRGVKERREEDLGLRKKRQRLRIKKEGKIIKD